MTRKLRTDNRNERRRERYAEQKQQRLDAQAGQNALRNAERMDGFVSQVTGAGITGVDKFKSYTFEAREDLSDETLECLYLDNDIAATVVERVVKDALRGGYGLTWGGSTDEQAADVVEFVEAKLNVTEVLQRTRIYSRLFGGGGTFIGATGNLKKPRQDEKEVEFLRAIADKDLRAAAWYANPAKANFSRVAIYDYQMPTFAVAAPGASVTSPSASTAERPVELHESYIVPFYGILTTDDRFRESGWGDSVLRRVYDALMQFEAAYQSVLHTLAENSIPVYKVEGLLTMLAAENADLLQARFSLLNAGKSNYRAIVLGENEEFLRVNAPLAEAANVVLSAMQRVSGAAGMPMTILWGMSPAGMNATGQSDLEIWNQQVAKEQSLILGPALLELYRIILSDPASPLNGAVPEDLEIKWPSLWTPSLQDEINNYAQVAGADAANIQSGVLMPEEVRLTRSGQGQFPAVDTAEDMDALEAGSILAEPGDADLEAPDDGPEGPEATPEGLATQPGDEPQKAALNGAQISGLIAIATSVADGTLPLGTAKAIALASFPLTPETADAIFADLPEGKFEEEQSKPDPVNPLMGLGGMPPEPGEEPVPGKEPPKPKLPADNDGSF